MKRNIKILLMISILFVTYVGCTRKDTGVSENGNKGVKSDIVKSDIEKSNTEKSDIVKSNTEKNNKEEALGDLRKTVAILGVDEGLLRTDVICVIRLDSESGKTDVISVPRDTKVIWGAAQKEAMKNSKGYAVSVSKINEMLAYGGKENIQELLLHEIGTILEMPIDHYVIVDLEAFTKIVDAIEGVEVDVPQTIYHVDSLQDSYIDLEPGLQVLDGAHAEIFVRFRRYPEGDVARIRAQHIFLKALADKVLSPQIIGKIPQLVPILFENIETDMGLKDVMKYIPCIKAFDSAQITYSIVPGEGRYENGISYFFVDDSQIEAFRSRLHASQNESIEK